MVRGAGSATPQPHAASALSAVGARCGPQPGPRPSLTSAVPPEPGGAARAGRQAPRDGGEAKSGRARDEGRGPGRRRRWRAERGRQGRLSLRSRLYGSTGRERTELAERAQDARPWRAPALGGRDGSVCNEWEGSGRLRRRAREGTWS